MTKASYIYIGFEPYFQLLTRNPQLTLNNTDCNSTGNQWNQCLKEERFTRNNPTVITFCH